MDFEKEAVELCKLVYGESDTGREKLIGISLRTAHAEGVLEGIKRLDEAQRKLS